MNHDFSQGLKPRPATVQTANLNSSSSTAGVPGRIRQWFAKPTAPYVMALIILGSAGAAAYQIKYGFSNPFAGSSKIGSTDIVLFDPVKFMNAQRAAASILLNAPDADLALTMTQVASQAESVIKEEAGGAIVLIKQAVVVPVGIPDITDRVLKRFGLSTTVPTVSTMKFDSLANVAPTDHAFTEFAKEEEERMNNIDKSKSDAELARIKTNQDSILP